MMSNLVKLFVFMKVKKVPLMSHVIGLISQKKIIEGSGNFRFVLNLIIMI